LFCIIINELGSEICTVNQKTEMNHFIKEQYLLIGPGSKDHGRSWFGLGKKKKGKYFFNRVTFIAVVTETVKNGNHSYPFKLQLPVILPPSYQGSNFSIQYEITVTVKSGVPSVSDLVSTAKVQIGGTLFDLNFL